MPHNKKKTDLIISCFYDSFSTALPVGFDWAQTLNQQFGEKYNVTILLHGENIKYGLSNAAYFETYGVDNPWASFLLAAMAHKVKVVICLLGLTKDGFTISQLLIGIKPVQFSIDFIAQSQLKGKLVIYDAQITPI